MNAPSKDVLRIGPFIERDGVYEHMGDEYRGQDAKWLYTAPLEVEQAMESRDFIRRACLEAQDIAAAAQEQAARYRANRAQLFAKVIEQAKARVAHAQAELAELQLLQMQGGAT